MTGLPNGNLSSEQSKFYQIKIEGSLDQHWSDWFEYLELLPQEDGTTLISGYIIDEAALYGLLKKIRDSGLKLISINRVGSSPENGRDSESQQE